MRPLLANAYAVAGDNDLRMSPGYGIWMLPQQSGVARKRRSGPQTALSNRQRHGLRGGCARPSKSDASVNADLGSFFTQKKGQ
jgi:hypothetical protein